MARNKIDYPFLLGTVLDIKKEGVVVETVDGPGGYLSVEFSIDNPIPSTNDDKILAIHRVLARFARLELEPIVAHHTRKTTYNYVADAMEQPEKIQEHLMRYAGHIAKNASDREMMDKLLELANAELERIQSGKSQGFGGLGIGSGR